MKRVGQVLKEARLKKNLTLEDVERETKIRKSVLINLEEGHYHLLPPPTFVKGLIKNYGDFLQLPTSHLLALFRREFDQKVANFNPPKMKTLRFLNLRLTPNFTLLSLGVVVFISLLIYLFFQYISLAAAPTLDIIAPDDMARVAAEAVEVRGQTDPENTVAVNQDLVSVDSDGNFSSTIRLNEGLNTIEIVATNKFGKSKKIIRRVQANLPPR